MKLYYYQDPEGKINFGDDLNPWIWGKLCPELFDNNDNEILVGIGTLLNNNIPKEPKKIVFSTGVGYGDTKAPPEIDSTWKFYCVRGPLSAKALNLPKEKSVIDGAYLLKNIIKDIPEKKFKFSYMPHFHYANESYKNMCAKLGIHYIDPSQNIEKTLDEILSTEILFSEAMHGAIVADCFNIPWVPIRTNNKILSFKWEDWCQSIEIKYMPIDIKPLWNTKLTLLQKINHHYKVYKNIILFKKLKQKGIQATYNSDEKVLSSKIKILNQCFEKMLDDNDIKTKDRKIKLS